jgi:hypothetical protein
MVNKIEKNEKKKIKKKKRIKNKKRKKILLLNFNKNSKKK